MVNASLWCPGTSHMPIMVKLNRLARLAYLSTDVARLISRRASACTRAAADRLTRIVHPGLFTWHCSMRNDGSITSSLTTPAFLSGAAQDWISLVSSGVQAFNSLPLHPRPHEKRGGATASLTGRWTWDFNRSICSTVRCEETKNGWLAWTASSISTRLNPFFAEQPER